MEELTCSKNMPNGCQPRNKLGAFVNMVCSVVSDNLSEIKMEEELNK